MKYYWKSILQETVAMTALRCMIAPATAHCSWLRSALLTLRSLYHLAHHCSLSSSRIYPSTTVVFVWAGQYSKKTTQVSITIEAIINRQHETIRIYTTVMKKQTPCVHEFLTLYLLRAVPVPNSATLRVKYNLKKFLIHANAWKEGEWTSQQLPCG